MESKWYCHSDCTVLETEGDNQTSSRVQLSIYQSLSPTKASTLLVGHSGRFIPRRMDYMESKWSWHSDCTVTDTEGAN